jgi:hypothetical protein
LQKNKQQNTTKKGEYNMDKITYIEEEMTSEQWENYCKKIKEENRQKIRDAQKNRNSTSPFTNTTAAA